MGRVFKFHNDVDTDQIIASQYLLLPNIEEMKVYTFESIDKDFAKKVKDCLLYTSYNCKPIDSLMKS